MVGIVYGSPPARLSSVFLLWSFFAFEDGVFSGSIELSSCQQGFFHFISSLFSCVITWRWVVVELR